MVTNRERRCDWEIVQWNSEEYQSIEFIAYLHRNKQPTERICECVLDG